MSRPAARHARREHSLTKRIVSAPVRFYRRYLSGLKRVPTCRFVPTCSEYALEAIEKRGAFVGALKAFWRILRCNPFCRGGYDPVDAGEGAGEHLHGPSCEHAGHHTSGRTRPIGMTRPERQVAGHP